MNKFFLLLSLAALFLFSFNPLSMSAQTDSLKEDFLYYQKVSERQKLKANDRLYILYRMLQKYEDQKTDITRLKEEIRYWEEERGKTKSAFKEPLGRLEKILVQEKEEVSRVVISFQRIAHFEDFLLKDPKGDSPPRIVIDFYDALNQVSKTARDIPIRNGMFSRVRTEQFLSKPRSVVRVVIYLKKETPYRLAPKTESLWVEVDKENSSSEKSGKKIIPVPGTKKVATPSLPVVEATSADFREELIEPGDLLAISVFPAEELSRDIVVQPDGIITLPLIGKVNTLDQTATSLAKIIRDKLSSYVSNPQVGLLIKRKFTSEEVFITGEIHSPGSYPFRKDQHLLELISSAGGFTKEANRRQVLIYRGDKDNRKTFTIDVDRLSKEGNLSKDFFLLPGDIVEVSRTKNEVYIIGEVRNPGHYEYQDGLRILETVSTAGGFTDNARISRSRIFREQEDKREVIPVNIQRIMAGNLNADVILQAGDIIYIPPRGIVSASWFVNTILPWATLISLIVVISTSL